MPGLEPALFLGFQHQRRQCAAGNCGGFGEARHSRERSAVAIVIAILPDRGGTAMHAEPTAGPRNRLAHETSPYLLQHAANPVDWYPWGAAAIATAKAADRPILLSIGYSACHWCHVMAHESFEDEATAAVMNRLFVNVKVDREERPDLDKVYQFAHQLLTQRGGGWPLTMFLAPDDLTPFFGGTYFPKQARYGMPAFADLLERVAGFYRDERANVRAQNAALRGVFEDLKPAAPDAGLSITREPIDRARRDLEAAFDERYGGFGPAPKFPHAASIERLLRDWQATAASGEPDLRALHMATWTLVRMTEGGIFDQLGGGFCRYSVDPFWMIPHFEKMLYDNGPLLALCAQAAVATGDSRLREAALATASWALREMRSPEGGFYSALDADSEGHEGRFYVWRRDEVEALLSPDEFRVLTQRYGLDREPNFEGIWHLHCFSEIAPEDKGLLDSGRAKLLRRARQADTAGTRRQGTDGLERPHDPRARDQRTPARRARAHRCRLPRRRFPPAELLAGGRPLRKLESRRRAIPGLSRRPCLPARCAARTDAGAVSRRRISGSPAKSPTRFSGNSWIARTAGSGSRPRDRIRPCIGRRILRTTRCPQATASRHRRSPASAG